MEFNDKHNTTTSDICQEKYELDRLVILSIGVIKSLSQAQLLVYAAIATMHTARQEDIESVTGLSKATVTKTINDLLEQGWIMLDGTIYKALYNGSRHTVAVKESIAEPVTHDIKSVFDYWNGKKIIVHKVLDDKTKRAIKSALKIRSKEDVYRAIDNYSVVLRSEEYYFSYKWTLMDFLNRGLHKFVEEAEPLVNYLKDKSKQTNTIDKLYGKYNI